VRAVSDDAAVIGRLTNELIVDRVRIGLWIMLGSVIAFAVASAVLRIAPSSSMYLLQAGLTAALALLLLLLKTRWAARYAKWIALASVVAACGFGAQMGVKIADATSVIVLQIALVMGAASLVPWGVRPQATTVLIVSGGVWWEFSEVAGNIASLEPSTTVALAVVFSASVLIAKVLATTQDEAIRRDLELETSQQMLRALSARLVFLQEEERRRIARELHDDLGQLLVALRLELNRVSAGDESAQLQLRERLGRAMMVLDETVKAVRNLSRELRPAVLDDIGLAAALDSQLGEFHERTGIDCELDLGGEGDVPIEPERATALFRIIQEAMTNVAQHAGAKHVVIRFDRAEDSVALTIEDDGRGISDEQRQDPRSLGLIGMRERARNWGGSVEITGRPGRGTRIRVLIPQPA